MVSKNIEPFYSAVSIKFVPSGELTLSIRVTKKCYQGGRCKIDQFGQTTLSEAKLYI